MIEIWLILTLWCDPNVPDCLIEKDITEAQVSTWDVCTELSTTLPPRFMASVPGLIAVGRCEKREPVKPKEKE